MPILRYRELAKVLAKLSPEQLDMPVVYFDQISGQIGPFEAVGFVGFPADEAAPTGGLLNVPATGRPLLILPLEDNSQSIARIIIGDDWAGKQDLTSGMLGMMMGAQTGEA